jgi:hypothetical protein
MPKTKKEAREEDAISKEPWQIQLVKHTQTPPRESLSANTILPSTLTTPMAEMATIEMAWIKMIEHQLIKAELYMATLPVISLDVDGQPHQVTQTEYKERIEAFKKEHYADYDDGNGDCKEFILISAELRHQIYMHSLSVMGKHHDDAQDMGKTVIESMGIKDDTGSGSG